MKKVLLNSILFLTVSIAAFAQGDTKTAAAKTAGKTSTSKTTGLSATEFKNLLDSFSYAAGFNVATDMQTQGITKLNTALMNKGIEDVFNKKESLLTRESIDNCIQTQLNVFAVEKSAANKRKGIDFLAANGKRKEVITLSSGLQYEVIKNGDANSPTAKAVDTVEVNYIGTLIDGTEFDNSYKKGQMAAFPVTSVITGWIEILQLMRQGDHWKVYIPSELGYAGGVAAGGAIQPNSVLVFEIVLEGIRPEVTPTPVK